MDRISNLVQVGLVWSGVPWNHEIGLADTVIVVNTSLNDKKNTFNFAEGTAKQAFELPNQAGFPYHG